MSDARRRVLVVSPFPPCLDATHGGARAIAHLVRELAERAEVVVACLRAREEPPAGPGLGVGVVEVERGSSERSRRARALRGGGIVAGWARGLPRDVSNLAHDGFAERLQATVEEWTPDVIQLEFAAMGQYLPALAASPAPRLLTVHEPGTAAARELASTTRGLREIAARADAAVWRAFEHKVVAGVQTVAVFSDRDRAALEKLGTATPVVRVALGATVARADAGLGEGADVVFVGNFTHRPNVDAARRLIDEIHPRVRAAVADARLLVVGDRSDRLQEAAGDGVIITGRVPDVDPFLAAAAVVAIPLRLGGGTRVKVLDALAAGRPVVASPRAVEGIDVVDGRHVVLAESDEQFARSIVALLRDPGRRASLAREAAAWAAEHAGWARTAAAYEALYDGLLAAGGPR